jgi:hypothetical protein
MGLESRPPDCRACPRKKLMLDAESELLLRCCAVSGPFADSPAMRELAGRGVDGDRFLALANRNSVTPMVGARLCPEGAADLLPPRIARALRLSYQVNALRSHDLAGCAAEIVDSFAAACVPAIAIKGRALAIAACAVREGSRTVPSDGVDRFRSLAGR